MIPSNPPLILQPFANTGDKTAPPQTDPSSFVNFADGYTLDYEIDLNSTNTNAKAVERQVQNYLFNLSTANESFWQQMTVAPWYSTMPGGYNQGAVVGLLDSGSVWRQYRSLVNANIVNPNAGGSSTSWEYIPLNAELLSQVAMPAGGGGIVRPGGQTTEIIAATTDFNTLTNGTWEFSTDAIANGSANAPAQLGIGSTFAGMLESKQWAAGANTFIVQRYSDRTGNAFFRGALNGSFSQWRSVTPVDNFSTDTGAANAVQGNANLSSTVLADNQRFWVKIAFANTGATTFSPLPGITARPLIGEGQLPLQGGELIVGGRAIIIYKLDTNNFVLVSCTGGAQQVVQGSNPTHAVALGQLGNRQTSVTLAVGATTALTPSQAGSLVVFQGGTLNLPSLASCRIGSSFDILSTAAGNVVCAGADTIQFNGTVSNNVSVLPVNGTGFTIVNGGSAWFYFSGITGLKYAFEFRSVLALNGYQVLPSGMIEQWGQGTTNGAGQLIVAFPIPFPNACLNVQATVQGVGTAGQPYAAMTGATSNTNLTIWGNFGGAGASIPVSWRAIGW